jgi:hypothetical protein
MSEKIINDVKRSTQNKGDAMTRLILTSAVAVILLLGGTGGAQETLHVGSIDAYHLNATVTGRGPCVLTDPAAPTTWICLYRTSPLYDELRETLREADQFNKQCVFGWSMTDGNGYAVLSLLECEFPI